jgi:galactoside O-acetyltransferase
MIKKFENYLSIELRDAGLTFGDNVNISNDVILHNPKNIFIGNNVRIDSQCILIAGKDTKIVIGNNVHISAGCYFFGGGGNIIMEDYTGTSSRTAIYTASDDYTEGYMTNPTVDEKYKKIKKGDVILKKHTIVGSASTILPGVTLEFGTSVGAHSLVNKSSSLFDLLFGSPAKYIKKRKNVYLK